MCFSILRRKGTPAAEKIQIPKDIKHKRAEQMKKLGDRLQREYLKKQVGKTVKVLFELESSPEFHQGYAPDYTMIKIPSKNCRKKFAKNDFLC